MYNLYVIKVTVLDNSIEKIITINQKHICSFEEEKEVENRFVTEVRMSNGDVWYVIDPGLEQWIPDAFITDTEY